MVRAMTGLAAALVPAGGRTTDEFFLLRCSERLDELMHVALLCWGTFTALEDELRR